MTTQTPDDDELKRLLRAPQPPESLREKLHADLERVVAISSTGRRRRWMRRVGACALLLLGAWGAWVVWTPADVTAAYADIQGDRHLQGVREGAAKAWLVATRPELPAGASVDLVKDCSLGERQSKHLRLRGPDGAVVNVFVHHQAYTALKGHGTIDDQVWAIRHPNPGTVVVVLYDRRALPAHVTAILDSLFPRPAAHRI